MVNAVETSEGGSPLESAADQVIPKSPVLSALSAPPVTLQDRPELVPAKADFDALKAAASAVQSALCSAETMVRQFPGSTIVEQLPALRQRLVDYTWLIHTINALPAPSPARDPQVGEALLPFVIWALSQKSSAGGNEKLLMDLYLRTHIDPETSEPQVSFADWLIGLQSFIAVNPNTKALPGCEPYLANSEELSPALNQILSRLSEKQAQLSEQEERNARSKQADPSRPGTYEDAIEFTKQAIAGIRSEIPSLFERLTDVRPEAVNECINAIGVRAAPTDEVLSVFIKLTTDLEFLLISALTPDEKASHNELTVEAPQFHQSGVVVKDSFSFPKTAIAEVAAHPRLTAELIYAYLDCRSMLRSFLNALDLQPLLAGRKQDIFEALLKPLSRDPNRSALALQHLLQTDDVALQSAALALLADPITGTGEKRDHWGYSLEDTGNFKPLLWCVKHYLCSAEPDDRDPFLKVMKRSEELQRNMLPFLQNIKALLKEKNYEDVARALNEEIPAAVKGSANFFKALTPVLALTVILQDETTQSRLKNQIPNLDKLKDIPAAVAAINQRLKGEVKVLVDRVSKGLDVSLSDYYQGQGMEQLWQFLKKFRIYMEHPELLQGIHGDEGMKSCLFVAGDFGVGKTFFVKCLQNELGIKLFAISPEKGDDPMKVCKEVKTHVDSKKEFVILLIDEAEAVLANRKNPLMTDAQRQSTTALLREISDIRLNYPKVLIVVITNFPEEIDWAVSRQGRLDIHIWMDKPEDALRRSIILDTLKERKTNLKLTTEQLDSLVKITDGMMPLPIKRTINELFLFGPYLIDNFKFNFQTLKAAYEEEKREQEFNLREISQRERQSSGIKPSPGNGKSLRQIQLEAIEDYREGKPPLIEAWADLPEDPAALI